jgi:hypothetical protein
VWTRTLQRLQAHVGRYTLCAAGLLVANACYGGADVDKDGFGLGFDGTNSADTNDDTSGDDPEGSGSDSETRLWRLTARQYERTVEAGLQTDVELPEIAITSRIEDFINKASDNQVDELFFATIEETVDALVVANMDAITGQLSCSVSELDEACLNTFLETFTLRVQRTDETNLPGYLTLFDSLTAQGFPTETALQGVVTAVLLSPKTLFRTELGASADAEGNIVRLTSFELAESLAYTVWDGPPDDELLAAAANGSLSQPEVFEAQLERMLATPEGDRGMVEFLSQWLGLTGFEYLDKNTTVFPEYEGLRDAMQRETKAFIEHVLQNSNASFAELIGSSQTVVDAELAAFYGVELPPGETSGLVDLPTDQRRGVFTHPAVISSMSEPTLTGVMHRGKVILKRLLCAEIIAPPDVEFPDFDEFPPEATTRDRLESLEETSPCSGCHVLLNPPAFAMENYDSIGRFRDVENGSPIDASGAVHAGEDRIEYANAPELFERLANHPAVHACFVKHALRYTSGRETTDDDDDLLLTIAEGFRGDADIRQLYRELVTSLAFRNLERVEDHECVAP